MLFLWDSHGFCWYKHWKQKQPPLKVSNDLTRNFFFYLPFIFPKTGICEIISKCFHIIYLIWSSKPLCKVGITFVFQILKQRLKETKWHVTNTRLVRGVTATQAHACRTLSTTRCTAPIVFRLFVSFKQRTYFFKQKQSFSRWSGVYLPYGVLCEGLHRALSLLQNMVGATLYFFKVPHIVLIISRI